MLSWKTSQQRRPIASSLDTPVISSAARLKEVIDQFSSTVQTPSTIESKITCRVCLWRISLMLPAHKKSRGSDLRGVAEARFRVTETLATHHFDPTAMQQPCLTGRETGCQHNVLSPCGLCAEAQRRATVLQAAELHSATLCGLSESQYATLADCEPPAARARRMQFYASLRTLVRADWARVRPLPPTGPHRHLAHKWSPTETARHENFPGAKRGGRATVESSARCTAI